jgi:DNA-binding LacI/PurR family transcriptional regulator
VELLIQQMAAPQVPIRELLPTRLIVRQSTWPREGSIRAIR